LRLKGEALALKGQTREAETEIREAVDVAARQGAKLFELRSAVSLCRLLPADEAAVAAGDLLAPACSWFAVDAVAPDLTEARALLAAIHRRRRPAISGDSGRSFRAG
jgi:predicted ATPase